MGLGAHFKSAFGERVRHVASSFARACVGVLFFMRAHGEHDRPQKPNYSKAERAALPRL